MDSIELNNDIDNELSPEPVKEKEKKRHSAVRGEIIAGLDIGTTKVCCVVGEAFEDSIDIIGTGIVPSLGMKKGVVVNIESTVKSIREAVRQAEEMAGCDLHTVHIGIAGSHIKGFNSPGIVGINNREIKQSDINDVLKAAKTVKITANQQIIHVLPQEYMVDDHTGIQNPLGMCGIRLVTNVHIVTADIASVQNLYTSCNKAGLEVASMALQSIASAECILTPQELDLGVVLVDIGGGTTDVAVFREGTIRHTCEIGLGGHNLTNDLSIGLRTPLQEAERLKEDYGSALAEEIKPNLVVEVPTIGDKEPRSATQKLLVSILEARIKEILDLVNKELIASGQKNHIKAGMVLTGGTALLEDIAKLAEQVFDMPVRVGYPTGVGGSLETVNTPRCTTAVGLVLYGYNSRREHDRSRDSILGRVKGWVKKII